LPRFPPRHASGTAPDDLTADPPSLPRSLPAAGAVISRILVILEPYVVASPAVRYAGYEKLPTGRVAEGPAMMVGLRRLLYKLARLLGDVNAVRRGRVGQRVARRTSGRVTGRVLRRLLR
jgi:hypothetical protein